MHFLRMPTAVHFVDRLLFVVGAWRSRKEVNSPMRGWISAIPASSTPYMQSGEAWFFVIMTRLVFNELVGIIGTALERDVRRGAVRIAA